MRMRLSSVWCLLLAAAVSGSLVPVAASDPGQATEPTAQWTPEQRAGVETHSQDIDVARAAPTSSTASGPGRVVIRADSPELAVVGVSWDEAPPGVEVRIRSFEEDAWTTWSGLDIESDPSVGTRRSGSEPIAILGATMVEVELTAPEGELLTDARVHVVDPGESERDAVAPSQPEAVGAPPMQATATVQEPEPEATGETRTASAMPTGVPTVLSRADWGADETLRGWRPELGRVTGAVIHHTAGRNDYSADEVPAIIRGIYRYHAVSLGWGDIGYNAIVDKFGRIWEGRFGGLSHPVAGAHAAGVNSTMFGISVMGDHSTEPVSQAAMHAVAQMTAWKFAVHGISPHGSAVGAQGSALPQRVVGHRDVGATACPGDAFYSRLGELRTLISELYPTMPTYAQPPLHSVRLAGADRFATSAATSQWSFGRSSLVYVATGLDYADALAGTPAAALAGAPVLLVRPDHVPAAALTELKRLRPSAIRVLGGSSAVSAAVLAELRAVTERVEVVAGSDRFDTAAKVSKQLWPDNAGTVYLASGQSAPDALGAAAAAAKERAPLLLVRQGSIPEQTAAELRRLSPDRVVVVGGPTAVSDAVLSGLSELHRPATIERVGGADRYATSALLVSRLWDRASRVFHATGATWPDALSASSAAAQRDAPVLLLKTTCATTAVRAQLDRLALSTEFVIGGPSAVSQGASGRTC